MVDILEKIKTIIFRLKEEELPTYVYQCLKCTAKFEKKQGYHDAPLEECPDPDCGGKVARVIQATPFYFKKEGLRAEKQKDGSRIYS
ncbi:hypothetical protein LCGC14_1676150 [marine sediment metagenome]|uniref:Putative regulatory protein FmdB zinc ribbon domain-containing protein n=1 Tax=marine sediment metagenome TaxID=412755 RepID=A0A0F9ICC3_9ZZZZ